MSKFNNGYVFNREKKTVTIEGADYLGFTGYVLKKAADLAKVSRKPTAEAEIIAQVLNKVGSLHQYDTDMGNGYKVSDYKLDSRLAGIVPVSFVKKDVSFVSPDIIDEGFKSSAYPVMENIPTPSEFLLAEANFIAAFKATSQLDKDMELRAANILDEGQVGVNGMCSATSPKMPFKTKISDIIYSEAEMNVDVVVMLSQMAVQLASSIG